MGLILCTAYYNEKLKFVLTIYIFIFSFSTPRGKLQEICVGSVSFENWSFWLLNLWWQRESDLRVMHLFDQWSSAILCSYWFNLDNLNSMSSSSVTSSHVSITLGNSGTDSHVAVFTVHVVGARSRVISEIEVIV